jgi:hypothetical protein
MAMNAILKVGSRGVEWHCKSGKEPPVRMPPLAWRGKSEPPDRAGALAKPDYRRAAHADV